MIQISEHSSNTYGSKYLENLKAKHLGKAKVLKSKNVSRNFKHQTREMKKDIAVLQLS